MSDPIRRFFADEALRRFPINNGLNPKPDYEKRQTFVHGAMFAFEHETAAKATGAIGIGPDNPPAYPLAYEGIGHVHNPGMSMRDAFAIAALQGLIQVKSEATPGESAYAGCAPLLAEDAFRVADAMMAERAKGKGE